MHERLRTTYWNFQLYTDNFDILLIISLALPRALKKYDLNNTINSSVKTAKNKVVSNWKHISNNTYYTI